MVRGRLQLVVAVLAALLVAEGAVLLLRPHDDLATVPRGDVPRAASYFSAADRDRAEDFRGPQRWLFVARLVLETGLLVALVVRPPRALLRPRRRPVLSAGLAGALLAVALTLVVLPVSAVSRVRGIDVGLVTRSWPGWATDVLLSTAISAGLTGLGCLLAVAAVRRFPRTWWVGGAAAVVLVGAGSVFAGPVVLDPLFNDFRTLPAGQARDDVVELARRAGVDVGRVQEMDASKRTTAANAYVTGLGGTKRVVVYDTLLREFERPQRRAVVAHELAHVHFHDVPRGLLFVLLVAPLGMFAVAVGVRTLAPRDAAPGPALVPALALSVAVLSTAVSWVANDLSRRVEARADAYSLRLTGDAEAFIAFEQRIARQNVSDPDPPRLFHLLTGTHPTTMERIAIGLRAKAQAGTP